MDDESIQKFVYCLLQSDLSKKETSYLKKKKDEITIRSSAAEYLTYVASVGDQQDSIDMRYADENIPDTPEEWLDGFNIFSIYQVLPQLIEIQGLKVQTDVSAKKTSSNRSPDDNTFIFTSLRTTGGISIRDLDLLTIGLVNDMYAEKSSDDYKEYKEVAIQEDFDKF